MLVPRTILVGAGRASWWRFDATSSSARGKVYAESDPTNAESISAPLPPGSRLVVQFGMLGADLRLATTLLVDDIRCKFD